MIFLLSSKATRAASSSDFDTTPFCPALRARDCSVKRAASSSLITFFFFKISTRAAIPGSEGPLLFSGPGWYSFFDASALRVEVISRLSVVCDPGMLAQPNKFKRNNNRTHTQI